LGIANKAEEMDESKVKCVACAEVILAEAKLCRHCGTLQNDERFALVAAPAKAIVEKKSEKPTCIRCNAKLKVSDHSLCVECIEDLDEYESVVFEKGRNMALCPKCGLFIFNKAQSTFCHVCTRKSEPENSSWWISWWLQVLLVLPVLFLPETLTDFRVFIGNVGGQLFGWNLILLAVSTLLWMAFKRRAKQHRLRSWIASTITFGSLGLFMLLLVLAIVASSPKY
jgi:hypothetical protein